jgi:hypothetical protein
MAGYTAMCTIEMVNKTRTRVFKATILVYNNSSEITMLVLQ